MDFSVESTAYANVLKDSVRLWLKINTDLWSPQRVIPKKEISYIIANIRHDFLVLKKVF